MPAITSTSAIMTWAPTSRARHGVVAVARRPRAEVGDSASTGRMRLATAAGTTPNAMAADAHSITIVATTQPSKLTGITRGIPGGGPRAAVTARRPSAVTAAAGTAAAQQQGRDVGAGETEQQRGHRAHRHQARTGPAVERVAKRRDVDRRAGRT